MTRVQDVRGIGPEPRTRPCPICAGEAVRTHERATVTAPGDAPRPVVCGTCEVVYVSPVPAAAVDLMAYDASYYLPWQGDERPARERLWRWRLSRVAARATGRSLLDVGCGDGLFLRVAREAGWSVEGIEFSPEGARLAARALGRPVAVGDLATQRGLRGPFDVITLWHVLEHLAEPAAMLSAVRARLRPGGLLVAAVPSLDALPARAAYRIVRGRSLPLFEPGMREPHLTHFSPRTLAAAFRRHGFEAVEVRADRTALTAPRRLLEISALLLSALTGRLLTEAIVAFARRPA